MSSHHLRVKAPNQFPAYLAMTYYSFRAQLRNRVTFVIGFIFPLVFISVFGFIGAGSTIAARIGVPLEKTQNPVAEIIKSIPGVKITTDTTAVLEEKLKEGKIDAVLQVSPVGSGFDVQLLTSSAQPQASSTSLSLVKGVVDGLNLKLAGITKPPVSLTSQELSGREFRYIDFALPGQIGFAVLGTSVFGTVFGLITLKKTKVLKRIFATPTRPLTILLGQGTSRLIIALTQTLVIILFGAAVFHFQLLNGAFTVFQILLLSAFGLLSFLGFGLLIAGLTSDENSAAPLAQLFSLPQFLLSGTFFPIDNFPGWLQPIASNLPLSYLNNSMRKVTSEGADLAAIVPYLLGMLVWGVIAYFLAAKTFKWE